MKIITKKELVSTGDLILLYGDTGVGKSVTSLQTAMEPVLYFMFEPRNEKKILIAAEKDHGSIDVSFVHYKNWTETLESFADFTNFDDYESIIIDSISHIISGDLSFEIVDENYESMDKKAIGSKKIIYKSKMTLEGFGALGEQMLRFTNLLAKLAQQGKTVICLARTEQNPKFNRELFAAPALKGKDYAKNMPGFFDFIGYVEPRIKDGQNIYPPYVSFESDGDFMAKWTGIIPEKGVRKKILDIKKILEVSKKEK